jgi:hypothetical protein
MAPVGAATAGHPHRFGQSDTQPVGPRLIELACLAVQRPFDAPIRQRLAAGDHVRVVLAMATGQIRSQTR